MPIQHITTTTVTDEERNGRTLRVTTTDHRWEIVPQPEAVPADTDIEPVLEDLHDDGYWIVKCHCGRVFTDRRLSTARGKYNDHRDLPRYAYDPKANLTANLLAI
jgi:hypothetical protein